MKLGPYTYEDLNLNCISLLQNALLISFTWLTIVINFNLCLMFVNYNFSYYFIINVLGRIINKFGGVYAILYWLIAYDVDQKMIWNSWLLYKKYCNDEK